jgi:uncharacterized protein (TIGR02246 family)
MMREFRIVLAITVLALAMTHPGQAAEPASLGTPADEAEIHGIIVKYVDAWNSKDAKALGDLFSESADFTSIFGQHFQGRSVIAQKHGHLFQGAHKESKQSRNPSAVTMRFLKPDVAALDSISEIYGVIRGGGETRSAMNRLLTNMVLMKNNGRWEIEVFHNMLLPEIPMPQGAVPEEGAAQQ